MVPSSPQPRAVERDADDRIGKFVFRKTGVDVRVVMLQRNHRNAEFAADFVGHGGGHVVRVQVAYDHFGRDLQDVLHVMEDFPVEFHGLQI